jgi:hypothetical protein
LEVFLSRATASLYPGDVLGLLTMLMLLLPEVVMPRPTELAAASADTVELERLATRLGPTRLVELFEDAANHKKGRLCAASLRGITLTGAAHADVGGQLLPPFCEALVRLSRAQKLDEKQLHAAGEALRRTASTLGLAPCGSAGQMADLDGDCDPMKREAAERLFALGIDATLPLPLREAALEGLALLPPGSFGHLVPRIVKLAQAPQPPGHGALVVLAALSLREQPEPLLTLVRTAEPGLASEAAQELCAVMAPRRGPHPAPLFSDEVATRLRTLAAAEQPLPQRQALLDCLRLLGTPADRALHQSISGASRKKGAR